MRKLMLTSICVAVMAFPAVGRSQETSGQGAITGVIASQIDAFLFWARTPYIVPEEDGTLWLRDARFSDPRATGRFEVRLPSDICDGVKTEPSGGNGG